MVSSYLNRMRPIEELRILLAHDEDSAAHQVESALRNDADAAVARIREATSVAAAKVTAEAHRLAAQMLTDAELAATRLTLIADMATAANRRFLSDSPPDIVEAMAQELRQSHGDKIWDEAMRSVETIRREADTAMTKLKTLGTEAMGDIHAFAVGASLKAQEAASLANDQLRYDRQNRISFAATIAEAGKQVMDAADAVTAAMRQTSAAVDRILQATAGGACRHVEAASQEAELRIEAARDRALARIQEATFFI
jgi:hypothetical protein